MREILDRPVGPRVQERLSMRSDADLEILFHWQRYLAAAPLCRNKRVLDCASGEGYGAHHLASVAGSVVGIDVDQGAVAAARARYRAGNLTFLHGSAERLPFADGSFEVVTSFETIEHLPPAAHARFLDEVRRVLVPDGVFLVSSPDRERTERMGPPNPFHLREYTEDELRATLQPRFSHLAFYVQDVNVASFLWPLDGAPAPFADQRVDHRSEEACPTSQPPIERLYLLAVCSAAPLDGVQLAGACQEIARQPLETLWNRIGNLEWRLRQAQPALHAMALLQRDYERLSVEHARVVAELAKARRASLPVERLRSAVGRTPAGPLLRALVDRLRR